MKPSLKNELMQIADLNDVDFTLVDVGARNGILHLETFARRTDAFGFEPNPEEYRKLISGSTDAEKIGILTPAFRNLSYFPYALGKEDGSIEFFITPAPGASGTLEPDLSSLGRFTYHANQACVEDFGSDHFAGSEKIEVESMMLDSFCSQHALGHIDFLKIDVEGSEYDVLAGSADILKRTGVVLVETYFVPFRKNQRLFSEVDLQLRQAGFDLLRYDIVQDQLGYKRLKKPTHYVPPFYYDLYGCPLATDAVYVNRGIQDTTRRIAQALILLEKKFVDEGLYLLDEYGVSQADYQRKLLSNPANYLGRGVQLRHYGYQMVDACIEAAIALYNRIKKGNQHE